MATRQLLAALGTAYEREGTAQVVVESIGGVDATRRVLEGEVFDFVVLAADAIDKLAAQEKVLAGSRVDLVTSGVAVAVRQGATRPDVATEDAVRHAVLAARNVGYSTGPSGVALAKLFDRWGITQQLEGRFVQAKPGVPVASLVARGDVELGFQQLSELLGIEGIDVIGPLPPAIQITTTFSAGVCSTSREPDATRALLQFMASPAVSEAKRRCGMEPA